MNEFTMFLIISNIFFIVINIILFLIIVVHGVGGLFE